jgi:hypothetical protein
MGATGAATVAPNGSKPGSIDHTPVDVVVVDERHRLPLGRPDVPGLRYTDHRSAVHHVLVR